MQFEIMKHHKSLKKIVFNHSCNWTFKNINQILLANMLKFN